MDRWELEPSGDPGGRSDLSSQKIHYASSIPIIVFLVQLRISLTFTYTTFFTFHSSGESHVRCLSIYLSCKGLPVHWLLGLSTRNRNLKHLSNPPLNPCPPRHSSCYLWCACLCERLESNFTRLFLDTATRFLYQRHLAGIVVDHHSLAGSTTASITSTPSNVHNLIAYLDCLTHPIRQITRWLLYHLRCLPKDSRLMVSGLVPCPL